MKTKTPFYFSCLFILFYRNMLKYKKCMESKSNNTQQLFWVVQQDAKTMKLGEIFEMEQFRINQGLHI